MSRRHPTGRDINGIILLDKASGLTSNAALQKVKRLFNANKAGHTGALDPLASGILPICLGQATKIAQFLLADDKCYLVRGRFGQNTDTADCEGKITQQRAFEHLRLSEIKACVQSFVGDILQVPPMFSALKKDGQPLYKLARQGLKIERQPRPVSIYKIKYLGYENGILSLEVACSKGTYIRTLIEDIGNKLGCGAVVIELRRIGFSQFEIAQSIKFDDLEKLKTDDYKMLDLQLLPSEKMLTFESIFLDKLQSIEISFGRKISVKSADNLVKIFDEKSVFLGIGQVENGVLQPKRLFI
ncbi:MAG: tRNA pseudouridine(55) synthase TruB [Candidatus Thioglobus sp.]|nr:tRNA pseudouridine(55) synthase TruB [Candidatus Thioglobus sp.]